MFTLTLEKLTAGSKKWRRMEEEILFWKAFFSGFRVRCNWGCIYLFHEKSWGKTVNLFLGRQCQKNEEFQAGLRRHVSEGQK